MTTSLLSQRLIEPRLEQEPPPYRTDAFRALASLPGAFAGVRAAESESRPLPA